MKFPWTRQDSSTGLFGRPEPQAEEAAPQKCPGLGKVLDKIERIDRPQVLDLGPFCGDTAVFLGERGARVSVAELEPPEPRVETEQAAGDLEPAKTVTETGPPLRLGFDDGQFDLVLVWEMCDFLPADRLDEFGSELHRVMAEGGSALLISGSDPPKEGPHANHPPRYRVLGSDQVERQPGRGSARTRHGHNPRAIERALAPLGVASIHLQRNQLREFIFHKKKKVSTKP